MIAESVREQLKTQFPEEKLYEVSSPEDDITIVVRGADHASLLKYRSMAMDFTGDTVKRASAAQFLCHAMVVWPAREELDRQLREKKKTGFYSAIVRKLAEICGDREGVTVGEL